jgi:HEAT repeat protein
LQFQILILNNELVMTDEECEQIWEFFRLLPDEPAEQRSKKEAFLREFREASDGRILANTLMVEALVSRVPEYVEAALLVGHVYGFTDESVDVLLTLLRQDWHQRHEDIVLALAALKAPRAVEDLDWATRWVPSYLEWDENRVLARKAAYALGAIDTPEARAAIFALSKDADPVIARHGQEQLMLSATIAPAADKRSILARTYEWIAGGKFE